jgi:hypothetical protein
LDAGALAGEGFAGAGFFAGASFDRALANSAFPYFQHVCAVLSHFMVIMLSDGGAKVQLARVWAGRGK